MMTKQVFNFGAGPSTLPKEILLEAQSELLNWENSGISILETGHRTASFLALMDQAENDLREILTIPKNYHVLFLGMPARSQFAMIPMNFLHEKEKGAYLISGVWSQLAYQEAQILNRAYCMASSEQLGKFSQTPRLENAQCLENTAYLYYTPNETIQGVAWPEVPSISEKLPLIADMTSCILSNPIDVTQYACIFAGTQKNIAPAGLTIVIIRDEFLQRIQQISALPAIFDYRTHIKHRPCYATPPVFSCYFAAKMFTWVKQKGGLQALYELNAQKAKLLYDYIDASDFYHCTVKPPYRSMQNVCFNINNPTLEADFIIRSEQAGLLALKGHRMVGGLRASLYNAMPIDGVYALIEFMEQFRGLY